MNRTFAATGAISALLAVTAGAFGAHALRSQISESLLVTWETGARYQMYHALGLLFVAIVAADGNRLGIAAGWLLIAGTVLFSGSLYALALTGVRGLGAITPVGGLCFLAGWACLVLAILRRA
ncbi:MAG: DUF423 domain-containing protein [Gemmatimonadales bacterium]